MNSLKSESLTEPQQALFDYFRNRYKNYEIIFLTSDDIKDLGKKFFCDYEKAEEIYRAVLQENTEKMVSCNELIQEYMESLHLVSTGNPEIDKLLNGGFYSSQLLEVIGVSGSGKTEFCLNLLKTGYTATQDKFLYLDSGQSFCYYRFAKLLNLEENPKNVATIQERIFHKTFFKNMDLFLHLTSLLSDLEKMSNPLQNPLRYIIIDSFSLISHPIIDFTDYDIWLSGLSKIFKILNNKYYIGILVTVSSRWEKKEFFGYRKKRILGSPWHFVPNISIFLEKTKSLNFDKNQLSVVTKYTLLQNEYNDPLRMVKSIENIVFK